MGGSHDFSCASWVSNRIRMQICPTSLETRATGFAAWPAYRLSNGHMWSMQRLNDCFRQQRFPYPGFASDVTIALLILHGRQRERCSLWHLPSNAKGTLS